MNKKEFTLQNEITIVKAVQNELPFLSNYQIEKILKNKDIRLNGKKISENVHAKTGDNVEVFYSEIERPWYTTIYEDDNIIIVNKKSGIEVVSETDRDLLSILKQKNPGVYAVHRIDRNTEGLVVFAKNSKAESELLEAFKKRTLTKRYLVECVGKVDVEKIKPKMYVKKLSDISKVIVAEVKSTGYDEIRTNFKYIKPIGDNSLLEAELITGKTHQIRVHLSYYGHYIVGDGKYGKGSGKLHLTAYYIKFSFDSKSFLSYLNTKSFEIMPTWL